MPGRALRYRPIGLCALRPRGHDVLEVVQNEEDRLLGQIGGERLAGGRAQPQRLRDRRQHEGRIRDRGERHKEHAVREFTGDVFGSLDRLVCSQLGQASKERIRSMRGCTPSTSPRQAT